MKVEILTVTEKREKNENSVLVWKQTWPRLQGSLLRASNLGCLLVNVQKEIRDMDTINYTEGVTDLLR